MANTPPRQPIHECSNEELLTDLCRELRHVAVSESDLPRGEHVVQHVREVRAIHTELAARRVDCRLRLEQLSEETGWQIPMLLGECLAYPEQLPYVREPDGIRRFLRYQLCSKAERIPDAKLFWFCNACMGRVLNAVRQRTPIPGIYLFRTYSPECRCAHADAETVLATDHYSDVMYGVCDRCLCEEIERRHAITDPLMTD